MYEVKEVLRLWLGGQGLRSVEKLVGIDRKTVRRYVEAAIELGLERDVGKAQLSDVFIAQVLERVRPHRVDGHGATWRRLEPQREAIKKWLDEDGLSVAKIHTLLTRQGICVPPRTLERYCAELCGPRRGRSTTVRVADGEPGQELQVDFGRMGILFDPATDRRRVCHALIFTPALSRYSFVWLTFTQTIESVIEGFEAAWDFFGGVFAVVIPDNMSGIVDKANPTEPRLNWAFSEYAQVARLPHRRHEGPSAPRTSHGSSAWSPTCAARSLRASTSSISPTPSAGPRVVRAGRRDAHPRDDGVPSGRALRHHRGPGAASGANRSL